VHQYGWRYLDLKPANLLLDSRGNLKLADFGTIRPLADTAAHAYTGTASWQAPEQFFPNAGGRYDTDARTDYFALGALFYWLVEGETLRYSRECAEAAREGRDRLERARAVFPACCLLPEEAQHFTVSVDRSAPGAGRAALELLRALLAPQRDKRPRHALDISRALARIRDGMVGAQSLRRAA
jgi:serine/threonine-protein kinase